MSNFVKIVDGLVEQRQPYHENGFIPAPDDVVCGMLWDGETFSYPPVEEVPLDPLRNLEPDQFHTMLNLSGYLPDIEAYLATSEDAVMVASARARLQYAKHFVRSDPLVVGIAAAIGLDPEVLDSLWTSAQHF